jgi:hypothetical protein
MGYLWALFHGIVFAILHLAFAGLSRLEELCLHCRMSSNVFTTQTFVAGVAKGVKSEEDRRFILETWPKAVDSLYRVSVCCFLLINHVTLSTSFLCFMLKIVCHRIPTTERTNCSHWRASFHLFDRSNKNLLLDRSRFAYRVEIY